MGCQICRGVDGPQPRWEAYSRRGQGPPVQGAQGVPQHNPREVAPHPGGRGEGCRGRGPQGEGGEVREGRGEAQREGCHGHRAEAREGGPREADDEEGEGQRGAQVLCGARDTVYGGEILRAIVHYD